MLLLVNRVKIAEGLKRLDQKVELFGADKKLIVNRDEILKLWEFLIKKMRRLSPTLIYEIIKVFL